MKRALADTVWLAHPDVPWQPPAQLPPEPLLRSALVSLEAQVVPADEDAIDYVVSKVLITYTTAGKLSDVAASLRHESWVDGLKDLPHDLLREAFETCAKTAKPFKFVPTPGEFRAFVQPVLNKRLTELKRVREMLKIAEPEKPKALPAPVRRAWPEFTPVESARMRRERMLSLGLYERAQVYENELAGLENRAPVNVQTQQMVLSRPADEKPKEVVRKRQSPSMEAALLRACAKKYREQGMAKTADDYERRAQLLYPIDDLGRPINAVPEAS